jgi:23S rRNA pseudouridine2605 synthase
MSDTVRLQKYLASCGVASRRKCEVIISEGRVTVNGTVVTEMGTKVSSSDVITVDGKVVTMDELVYIVINKPPGYLCTRNDRDGRPKIYDIVDNESHSLFSAGRLDYHSSGLLVLTNDGVFCNDIIHPSRSILKEYTVTSHQPVPETLVTSFLEGVEVEGVTYRAVDIKVERPARTTARIVLSEGKKREIRVVYKKFSVTISNLCRTSIGAMRLDDCDIAEGSYRYYKKVDLEEAIYGSGYNHSN